MLCSRTSDYDRNWISKWQLCCFLSPWVWRSCDVDSAAVALDCLRSRFRRCHKIYVRWKGLSRVRFTYVTPLPFKSLCGRWRLFPKTGWQHHTPYWMLLTAGWLQFVSAVPVCTFNATPAVVVKPSQDGRVAWKLFMFPKRIFLRAFFPFANEKCGMVSLLWWRQYSTIRGILQYLVLFM